MSDDDVQQAVERIGLSDNKDVKVSYYLNNFIISAINLMNTNLIDYLSKLSMNLILLSFIR